MLLHPGRVRRPRAGARVQCFLQGLMLFVLVSGVETHLSGRLDLAPRMHSMVEGTLIACSPAVPQQRWRQCPQLRKPHPLVQTS